MTKPKQTSPAQAAAQPRIGSLRNPHEASHEWRSYARLAIIGPMMSSQFASLAAPLYRRYWLGSLASIGGWQLLFLGQSWLIFHLTHSTVWLGYLGAASALPNMAMALFGSALADRFDKRKVLMLMCSLTAALLALLTALDWSGHIQAWQVLVIVAASSLAQGVDMPTRQALFPHLIDRATMTSAVAMNSMLWQGTRMIVPAFGGVLLEAMGSWMLFALATVGSLVMLMVLRSLNVQVSGHRHASHLQQTLDGFRFVFGNRLFLLLFALAYSSSFFCISFMQMMPALADMLAAGKHGYGVMVACTGIGSVLGTLTAPSLARNGALGKNILMSAAASAICIGLLGVTAACAAVIPAPLFVTTVFAVLGSLGASLFMVSSMTVLQMSVPDELRGRVMGLHGITFSLMSLGGLLTGFVGHQIGAAWAVTVSASIYLLVIITIAATQPTVRRIAFVPHSASG